MAEIKSIEFISDPNPGKQDLLKIHLTFNSDEIYKPYVVEISHRQGQDKTLINEFKHGLFLIQAIHPDQVFEHSLKNKIS